MFFKRNNNNDEICSFTTTKNVNRFFVSTSVLNEPGATVVFPLCSLFLVNNENAEIFFYNNKERKKVLRFNFLRHSCNDVTDIFMSLAYCAQGIAERA